MLDLRSLREDPDGVKAALRSRGDTAQVDAVLEADVRRRETQKKLDDARAEQKRAGKDVAKLQGEEKQALLAQLKQLSEEVAALEASLGAFEAEMRALLLQIPNIPHPSVPTGTSEDDNVVARAWGDPPRMDFEPQDHLALGEALGIIDMERGAKVSGARFTYLLGKGALLWLALSRFAVDTVVKNGHTPVLPPVLVREEAMVGTGFFPAAADQIYQLEKDELYLVGTSEVPLAALHMGEILDGTSLPLRYVAQSACFRREAGAAGKDTRGIFRNHQFEKVEMFVFTTPEESWAEHERLVGIEEQILQALDLPYRAMVLCTADLGAPSAKTIDLEVWFPGQDRFRETTSCSNTTDYQARRLNVRMRTEEGMVVLHTLNGTAATSSRHIAAILENYQQADGSVVVPEVLRPYTGFDVIEPR